MRRVLAVAVLAAGGCGEPKPTDPVIRAERTVVRPGVEARVGPVGGGYQHGGQTEKYEGPASHAPAWTK